MDEANAIPEPVAEGNAGVTEPGVEASETTALAAKPVQRDRSGRLLPGHTLNPHGRPLGSHNNSTKAYHDALRRSAGKAARVVEQELRNPLPWVRLAAARTILERVGPLLAAEEARGDDAWIKHATFDEVETIRRIMSACQARRGGDVFGSESLPGPNSEPASLPAPQPLEAAPDELVFEPQPAELPANGNGSAE